MNRIRREVVNGLLVLIISTSLSAAIAAFQIKFNILVWALIVMAVAIAVTGYVVFEFALGHIAASEARELANADSMRQREDEWLKRVGTPARLLWNREGDASGFIGVHDAIKAAKPGSDYVALIYFGSEGGSDRRFMEDTGDARMKVFSTLLDGVRLGRIGDYKRIICFDRDVLTADQDLESGILRVGEGPGTIERALGEHCREMMKTKGCSLFVAPAVYRGVVAFIGADRVYISVETASDDTGGRRAAGIILFCDPPNGEIVGQFRQIERETERHMVAVHKIIFPEDSNTAPRTAAL